MNGAEVWETMQRHGLYVTDKTPSLRMKRKLAPEEQAYVDLMVMFALIAGRLP